MPRQFSKPSARFGQVGFCGGCEWPKPSSKQSDLAIEFSTPMCDQLEFVVCFIGGSFGLANGTLLVDETSWVCIRPRNLCPFEITSRGCNSLIALAFLHSPMLQLRPLNPSQQSCGSADALVDGSGEKITCFDNLPSKIRNGVDALDIYLITHAEDYR
jgi:hypothetical protein